MSFVHVLGKSKSLLTAVPMFGLATGALFPITALHLHDLEIDPAFIGLVTTLYYCGSFLAALTFGKILSRTGYRLGFIISAMLAATATFSLTLTDDPVIWLLLRFLGGVSLGAYYVVVDGWFQAIADRRSRGKLFAMYETVRLAATAFGPFLLVLGSINENIVIVALAYLISIAPILFTEEPGHGALKSYRFKGLLETARCFPAAILIAACGGTANASFYGLSAIYASEIGLSVEHIAFFVAFVLVAPAISELPLGVLADRFTRMGVAVCCSATALITCLVLISLQTSTLWIVCIGGAIVGGSMVPMFAFGLSRIVDANEGKDTVEATSAGPVLAGLSMTLFGAIGLYVFLSMVASVALFAALGDIKFSRCCPEQASV